MQAREGASQYETRRAMSPDYVIETQDLTKRFGKFEAVGNLNLRAGAGRITGFLGRNGAGKSSTIKMLLGICRPSSGTGILLGRNIDSPVQCSGSGRSEQPLLR